MDTEAHGIALNSQMRLRCWSRIAHLSMQMRRLLSAELERIFEHPQSSRGESSNNSDKASSLKISRAIGNQSVIDTMLELITNEGA